MVYAGKAATDAQNKLGGMERDLFPASEDMEKLISPDYRRHHPYYCPADILPAGYDEYLSDVFGRDVTVYDPDYPDRLRVWAKEVEAYKEYLEELHGHLARVE